MTLRRLAIRQRAAEVLRTKVAALGGRAFTNRVLPLQLNQLPAAVVYTEGESLTLLSSAPILHKRTLRLVVSLVVNAHEGIDDTIDRLAQQAEDAIYGDNCLDLEADDITLTAVEGPNIKDDGETLIGEVRLVWEVLYESSPSESAEELLPLELVHAEIETHAPRSGPELVADIELEVAP